MIILAKSSFVNTTVEIRVRSVISSSGSRYAAEASLYVVRSGLYVHNVTGERILMVQPPIDGYKEQFTGSYLRPLPRLLFLHHVPPKIPSHSHSFSFAILRASNASPHQYQESRRIPDMAFSVRW
jgi:hypothetical protein